MTRFLHL